MKYLKSVQVGSPIPIQVQLHDGAENKPVVAVVLDPVGAQLEKLDLVAGTRGFYFSSFFQMPDLPFVTVQVFVLEDDSTGQPYAIVSEQVYSTPKPVPAEKIFRGSVISSKNVEQIFKGVLRETSIVK